MSAELILLLSGLFTVLITLKWVRERALLEKYAVYWVIASFIVFLIGAFPNLLISFSSWAHLSNAATALLVVLAFAYIYAFAVTVELSHVNRRCIRLTQESGLLEQRIASLEEKLSATTENMPGDSQKPTGAS